ncbi:hypothetical protein H6G04_08280 [Calothrix membranacea FACHB-236]|nr:hypothetical protein [Calothrix membranacea FACHB-236]
MQKQPASAGFYTIAALKVIRHQLPKVELQIAASTEVYICQKSYKFKYFLRHVNYANTKP